jgi:predicted cobalt transporter CbtA
LVDYGDTGHGRQSRLDAFPQINAGLDRRRAPHCVASSDWATELENIETNAATSLSHQFVVAVTLTSLGFCAMLGGFASITSRVFPL